MPTLSVKTDRQMAAARAEQSEQRERDECEFHLVSLAVGQRGGIERQGRTDLHRTLNTVLKKPRRGYRRGFLCAQAGRPIRPNTNVPGNWYLSG